MSIVSELLVRISADTKQLETGLASASGAVDRVDKNFLKITDSTLSWQAALGVLAGATGIALAAKKIFDIGAAVEETASKFSTVFGPASVSVQAFIDDFAAMAGLTDQSAKDIIATTGAIVQGMGFAEQASADFAVEVVKLAGDFASFNNVPIEETSRAIQSALTGERESLKKLGVVILEADVQKRALTETGKANAAALTQQEKATATLALITERAGVAVGDLERTQDSSANTARRVTAELLNFRDGIAVAALPALNVFLQAIGESTGGLDGFADRMQRMAPIIAAWARFAVAAFKTVAVSLASVARIAFNTGQIMGESMMFFAKIVARQFKDALDIFKSSIGNMGDMVDAVEDVVVGFDDMRLASGEAWATMEDGTPIVKASTLAIVAGTAATNGLVAATQQLTIALPVQRAAVSNLTSALYTSAQSAGALERAQNLLEGSIGDTTAAMDVYRGLVGDTQAAEDTFTITQDALDTLLNEGKISQDEYNEAMKVAEQRMRDAEGASVDLRGSLSELLSNFTDLGLKIPESVQNLVTKVGEKWAILNAILTAPATLEKIRTDWVTFFNNLAEAVVTFWSAIKSIADKVQGFFLDIGGAGQNFGGGLTLNVNQGGAGTGGGTDVSPLLIQWVHESRAYQLRTANAAETLSSYAPHELTLLASIRDYLVSMSLTLTSIEDKEWSPQIVVNMQGGGGAVTSGFVQGSASFDGFDQGMATQSSRRNALRTGDNSI